MSACRGLSQGLGSPPDFEQARLAGSRFARFVRARCPAMVKEIRYGAQENRSHRRRTDRRHAGPSGGPEGTGRCGDVRHHGRPAAGQGARSLPVRSGGRLQRQAQGHQQLRRYRRRRCGDRHRRRAAQAGHEPRRSARHQPQGDGGGGRGHQGQCPERLRHLHHQSARRDGVGAAANSPACRTTRSSAWRACWTARASAISWPRN